MRSNNQSNRLIKLCVTAVDFLVLWLLLYAFTAVNPGYDNWSEYNENVFWMACSAALLVGELRFSTIIAERRVGGNDILKRTTMLVSTQALAAYLLLRMVRFQVRIGWHLFALGIALWLVLIVLRLVERWLLKRFRSMGYNTRHVTLVGSARELDRLYKKLVCNPTLGYRVKGCYTEMEGEVSDGTAADFSRLLDTPGKLLLGDELYLCVSRKERDLIMRTVHLCERNVTKFYYLPPDEESLNLQPVLLDDIEVHTTYSSPLEDPLNSVLKRVCDIVLSAVFLLLTGLLLPFIVLVIKWQSPGPIFFKQMRTGLDGHDFICYKFRSMHVNGDADRMQATKDDPRKYPFGNFMRKANIDELPQFWNVLRGDMSIVGPRPHMLAHTREYSQLIEKYMVRHFVRPGVTGWAQVTGFRGETKELWQMEGRVERDIWYIQNWSLWLDARIIWMTVKSMFCHDEKAY